MAFRSKEMVKKIMKNIGGEKNLNPGVKESLKKCLPESKVVMGRAHRGIFAGKHIRFGNSVSEKGGNKLVHTISNYIYMYISFFFILCLFFLWDTNWVFNFFLCWY